MSKRFDTEYIRISGPSYATYDAILRASRCCGVFSTADVFDAANGQLSYSRIVQAGRRLAAAGFVIEVEVPSAPGERYLWRFPRRNYDALFSACRLFEDTQKTVFVERVYNGE